MPQLGRARPDEHLARHVAHRGEDARIPHSARLHLRADRLLPAALCCRSRLPPVDTTGPAGTRGHTWRLATAALWLLPARRRPRRGEPCAHPGAADSRRRDESPGPASDFGMAAARRGADVGRVERAAGTCIAPVRAAGRVRSTRRANYQCARENRGSAAHDAGREAALQRNDQLTIADDVMREQRIRHLPVFDEARCRLRRGEPARPVPRRARQGARLRPDRAAEDALTAARGRRSCRPRSWT